MITDKPISQIMAKTVWTARTEDTSEKVEELMNRHSLFAVPVVNPDDSVFGIISTADLLHLHTQKKNPKAIRAWELCSSRPVSVSPDTSISEVAGLMIKNRIHHVPIVENGKLCGFVSALDFVQRFVLDDI